MDNLARGPGGQDSGSCTGGGSAQPVLQSPGGLIHSLAQQRVGVDLSTLLVLSAGPSSLVPAVSQRPALLQAGDLGNACSNALPHLRSNLPMLNGSLAVAHAAAQQVGMQPIQPRQLAATQPTPLGRSLLTGSMVEHMHGLSVPVPAGASVHKPRASLLCTTTRPAHIDAGGMLSAATLDVGGFPFQGHRTGHLLANHSSDETESHNSEASRPSEACGSSDGSDSGDKKCRAWKIMLTAQQAVQIYKQMPADSLHITSKSVIIGKQYGVSAKTIRDIWKRETWVKATRHVWSEADERQYRQEEKKHPAATTFQAPPPGSVASLLSNEVERSPSPHHAPVSTSGSVGPSISRSRGRPKGVKDSRPRKRRCLSASAAAEGSGRGTSVTSTSSQATWSLSPAPGSRSPSSFGEAPAALAGQQVARYTGVAFAGGEVTGHR